MFEIFTAHITYYIAEVEYFRVTLKDFIDYIQNGQILPLIIQMGEWKERNTA